MLSAARRVSKLLGSSIRRQVASSGKWLHLSAQPHKASSAATPYSANGIGAGGAASPQAAAAAAKAAAAAAKAAAAASAPIADLACAKQVSGDDDALDLRRALVDLQQLGVTHQLFDRKLLGVAIAAEDLNGVCGHPHRRVRAVGLGERG